MEKPLNIREHADNLPFKHKQNVENTNKTIPASNYIFYAKLFSTNIPHAKTRIRDIYLDRG